MLTEISILVPLIAGHTLIHKACQFLRNTGCTELIWIIINTPLLNPVSVSRANIYPYIKFLDKLSNHFDRGIWVLVEILREAELCFSSNESAYSNKIAVVNRQT